MKSLITCCILLPASLCCQNKLIDLQNQFPSESAVHLLRSTKVDITVRQGKIQISADRKEESMALNNTGVGIISQKRLFSNSFVKVKLKKAETLALLESGDYKKIESQDVTEKASIDAQIFYDDNRVTVINYPAVTVGSITRLQSEETFSDSHIAGQFFFHSYVPSLVSELSIRVDNQVRIQYILRNCTEADVKLKIEKYKNYSLYTWRAENTPKFGNVNRAPNLRYYVPHIIYYVSDVVRKDDTVRFMGSTQALYSWYYRFVNNVSTPPTQELKNLIDSLVAGAPTEFEKVSRILAWVQDNIKYIAFEDGLGGFVPRAPNLVFEKRYGDCKDMANIIREMLRHCGIPGYLVWIGTRNIPYVYKDVPCTVATNHMIAAYKDSSGKTWLLDGTGKNAPTSLYTSMLQGKQALIGLDSTNFELLDVPIISFHENTERDSVSLVLAKGKLNGSGLKTLQGYSKVAFDHPYALANAADLKEYLTGILQKGNNTFLLNNYHCMNVRSRDQPTQVHYAFSIDQHAKNYGDELYMNFHLDKSELQLSIEEDRGSIPLEFDYALNKISKVALQIPEGYKLESVPSNVSYSAGDFGFDIQYEARKDQVVMEKHFYCKKLLVLPAEFPEWSKMLVELNKAFAESVALKKL